MKADRIVKLNAGPNPGLEMGGSKVSDDSGLLSTNNHLVSEFEIIFVCIVSRFPNL